MSGTFDIYYGNWQDCAVVQASSQRMGGDFRPDSSHTTHDAAEKEIVESGEAGVITDGDGTLIELYNSQGGDTAGADGTLIDMYNSRSGDWK